MNSPSPTTTFIVVLAITILIRQLYMSKYHHGKSFYLSLIHISEPTRPY